MKRIVAFLMAFIILSSSMVFADEEKIIDENYKPSLEEAVDMANKEVFEINKEPDYYDISQINSEMYDKYGVLVYGSPSGDKKGDMTRYVGYTPEGEPFGNPVFPLDAWAGGTYDDRDWIAEPWEDDSIKNQFGIKYNNFNGTLDYNDNMKAGLMMYQPDKTDGSRDDWHKYMQILQPPTEFVPGQAKIWHSVGGKIWYAVMILPSHSETRKIIEGGEDPEDPIDDPIPLPEVIIYDKIASPNLAVKWDTVPIKVNYSSSTTGKIQRDSYPSWNEYKYTVYSWYPNEKVGKVVRTNVIRSVPFSNDMFLVGGYSWFNDAKASYTVPSNAKPGTVLILKLDLSKRVDESRYFPSMPPRPIRPRPPHPEASNAAWSSYYRRLEIWRKKMEDWYRLYDTREYYLERRDYDPSIISASGYNYSEYRAHHSNLNSFVGSHFRRYVSIEGTGTSQYWFTRSSVNGQAESKNIVVHSAIDKGPGGIDPGIIVPD